MDPINNIDKVGEPSIDTTKKNYPKTKTGPGSDTGEGSNVTPRKKHERCQNNDIADIDSVGNDDDNSSSNDSDTSDNGAGKGMA